MLHSAVLSFFKEGTRCQFPFPGLMSFNVVIEYIKFFDVDIY